ncbi:DUF5959 family protein [Streptomyces showdoensis]|uniref:DUF5959 family protein n=1 Tax=Streptomyces showdoensis TaxID=68268 RepID=UPI0035F0B2CD
MHCLGVGEAIAWLHVQRRPSLCIHLNDEREYPEVMVKHDLVSMTTVWVPIALPDDWTATHRGLLGSIFK